jgi:hypothetical protein
MQALKIFTGVGIQPEAINKFSGQKRGESGKFLVMAENKAKKR